MTPIKLSCIVALLLVAFMLPTTHTVNALPGASVSDAGRNISGQLTVLAAAKKRGRNVCDANFKYCLSQCKKSGDNLFCTSACNNDHWWCVSVCGGKPC